MVVIPRPLVVALSLLVVSCKGEHVSIGSVTHEQPFADALKLVDIALARGKLRIEHTDLRVVELEADVRVVERRVTEFTGESLRFTDHVLVEFGEDGTLRVRNAHDDAADVDDWQLSVTVRVPDAPAVRADVEAGQISVTLPASGALELEVDAGQVDAIVDRIAGPVDAKVGAGQIRLACREECGSIDASVDAGKIALTLPEDVSAGLDAAVDVGHIDLAERFGVAPEQHATSQRAAGPIGEGGAELIKLRVDAGQIWVR